MSLATSNLFAVLDKKSKKSSSKDHDKKKKKKSDKKAVSTAELEKAIFSQAPINITSWADEDDDDEFALPPLPAGWDQVQMAWLIAPEQNSCTGLTQRHACRRRPMALLGRRDTMSMTSTARR
jgi:hypothetical protein